MSRKRIDLFLLNSYRDFRNSTGPNYDQTVVYWNVTSARLAFIIVFEHVIFFIIYLMQWLVPDVPKYIQNKIDHERYIDQRERWSSKFTEDNLKEAMVALEASTKMMKLPRRNSNDENTIRPRNRDKVSSENL